PTSTHTLSLHDALPIFTFDEFQSKLKDIRAAIQKVVVGQELPIELMLTANLCGGHCLMVGVPGLAKTLLVKTLAHIFNWKFKRIDRKSTRLNSSHRTIS